MPFTPFHFGPGALVSAAARKYVSFLAFCAVNVLIDVESLYNMLTRQPRIHTFLHTYVGATVAIRLSTHGSTHAGELELLHDGCPVACVGDAAFAYVNGFSSHVNVGFYHGASLDDPAGLLEGNGKRMRHIKLRADIEPDVPALRNLIEDAHADMRKRLAM